MSTENEAGSTPPAAESAAAHEGAAPEGAPAATPAPPAPAPAPAPAGASEPADAPPAPAAPPVSAPASPASPSEPSDLSGPADLAGPGEPRTEVLPTQAPPPVGPPSPYGPPPSELTGQAPPAYELAKPQPVAAPAAAPAAPVTAPPAPAAAYPSAPPAAAPVPPQAPPAYEPQAPYTPHTAAFGAEQPPQPPQSPQPPQGQPFGQQQPIPDPFAVPVTPSYATPQPGAPGSGAPGGPGWGTPMPAGDPSGVGPRKRRGLGGMVAAVLVAALVAGGVGGGVGYYAAKNNDGASSSTTVSAPNSSKALNRAPTSVAGIANRVLPSVVTIKAQNNQESDTGTGFVFDKEGHILTNNHVVAPGASGGKLTVTFSNGNTYNASVVGRAQGYDVAVIKLQNPSGVKLTPLPLGNSDDALVGDATIAIGAPYGLSGTVTTGIVSAVHRPVASSDGQGSAASYMSAIQTDASINPGNSGGPLLNANGAVIGINSAIQPSGDAQPGQQGGSVGLGFAIPINQAKRVAEQLIKTGRPVYPVIGVSLDTQYDGDGAKISTDSSTAITAGGPGDKAGLKPGDVITRFDGTLIDSGETLIGEIWQHQPGDKVSLTYTRAGATHTTTVVLGSRIGDTDN